MLNYQIIYDINRVNSRLKRGYSLWYGDHSRDADTLLSFTWGDRAREESEANRTLCLQVARELSMDLVIIKPNIIQLAGSAGSGGSELAGNRLFGAAWRKQYAQWLDSSYGPVPVIQNTQEGEVVEFASHRRCMCLEEHQGVYDVATGVRLTNRKHIIERIWSLGFATQRGRPPSIARLKYTGTRNDLEEITQLADRYWTRGRRGETEVAKKIVSAYRSINRYAAWPGAW